MSGLLRRIDETEIGGLLAPPVDETTLGEATRIVNRVRASGEAALREFAEQFGEIEPGARMLLGRDALERAASGLESEKLGVLQRCAGRVRDFAEAQRGSLSSIDQQIDGGRIGHTIEPMARVGCYAPGGRYPLPSSVLMTAIPARVAGVDSVIVASPRPTAETLAAAFVAGADGVLAVGGAHAIAALAYGVGGVEPVDFICGPGNRWVTAAKQVVSASVGIDMLAGPSELLVIADEAADARLVAADLLAQAEHDPDARPWLVTTSQRVISDVEHELAKQLSSLPTSAIARAALGNGGAILVGDVAACIRIADRLAPEHLEIQTRNPGAIARRVRHAGAVFVGSPSAEVLGDYALGPNHTLPTGGSARFRGGLSVLDFLRVRTYIELDHAPEGPTRDAIALARIEGLEAHARSAQARL